MSTTTTTTEKRGNTRVRKIAVVGMLTALAEILMILDFSLPMLIPFFVKMDFSELPALIASFVISPLAGVAVCLLKNVIHLFFTSTGGIGELCNFLLGAMMVFPAGLIYKHMKTRKGAVIACLVGCVVMAVMSAPINYYISYPVYLKFMGLEDIISEYQKLNPAVSNLWDALIWFNAPFTFVKGLLVSVITFVIYKPLSNALKRLW